MNVSQKQIAEKLGVSISLVSRVLSGRAKEIGIAQPTIDKVLAVAHEMGYVPNVAAQSLKGKSTRTIGVVVYDFKDPFFGTMVHHLNVLAHDNDYTLLLVGFQNRTPDERDLQPLSKFALDGIIAVGSDFTENWLANFGRLPCARIGFGSDKIKSLKITSDDRAGYEQLAEHLKSTKVQRIAFLGSDTTIHRTRSDFFQRATPAFKTQHLFAEKQQRSSFEIGRSLANKLIQSDCPDALVCANDRIAMGAIHAANEAGIRVPDDLRVIGYDDIPTAAQFIPPLTTIRQPIAAIAEEAFHAVTSGPCPSETRLLASELVIRTSA